MRNKLTFIVVAVCVTFLCFLAMERTRLCDFHLKAEGIEVSAMLNYELNE